MCHDNSGKNKPLGQMLITNQRIDKLATAWTFFTSQGMLSGSLSSMANALLGIFSSTCESQANSITHGPSAQPILSYNQKDPHATIKLHQQNLKSLKDDLKWLKMA